MAVAVCMRVPHPPSKASTRALATRLIHDLLTTWGNLDNDVRALSWRSRPMIQISVYLCPMPNATFRESRDRDLLLWLQSIDTNSENRNPTFT